MRPGALVDQARFAYPRFPDQGYHLPVASLGTCQGLLQDREFRLAPDEARQAACRGRLQAPADATGPGQLEDLHRCRQALDGHRT